MNKEVISRSSLNPSLCSIRFSSIVKSEKEKFLIFSSWNKVDLDMFLHLRTTDKWIHGQKAPLPFHVTDRHSSRSDE